MKPSRLTASALPRVSACPASAVLAQHDYRTEFAEDGQERHSEMEAAVINREYDKLPSKVAALLAEYEPEDIYPELILVYDYVLDVARTLDKRAARDYSGSAGFEIPGTTDIAAVDRARKRGLIVDWKGWEEVGVPETNTQTLLYAIALARVFDLDEVTVAISYLGAGKQHTEIATLDELDFGAYQLRLKRLSVTVAKASIDPASYTSIGRQCRWCPAFVGPAGITCPAQQALALELQTDDTTLAVEGTMPFVDDDDAANAYEFLARLGVLSKRLRDGLYARAAQRPFALRGGTKMLGKVSKLGNEKLDGDTVYRVVLAKHGQEVADLAVERSATKTKLQAAMVTLGSKSATALKEEVLKEVRALGGARKDMKTSIEEYPVALASGE